MFDDFYDGINDYDRKRFLYVFTLLFLSFFAFRFVLSFLNHYTKPIIRCDDILITIFRTIEDFK